MKNRRRESYLYRAMAPLGAAFTAIGLLHDFLAGNALTAALGFIICLVVVVVALYVLLAECQPEGKKKALLTYSWVMSFPADSDRAPRA